MLNFYNPQHIQHICKFLDYNTIHNLKMTCKTHNKNIPKEYLICSVYNRNFTKNFHIFNHMMGINLIDNLIEIPQLVFPKHLERLSEIQITHCHNIYSIHIKCNNLREINIQSSRNCKDIIIDKNMNKLHIINLSNLHIDNFIIEQTWTKLFTLCLAGTKINNLFIPKECVNLNFINVSGCPIEKIIFESNEQQKNRTSTLLCYYIQSDILNIYKYEQHKICVIPNEDQFIFKDFLFS